MSVASNDNHGLTQHPAVVDPARRALDRWGAGSGSARLIVGSRPIHDELERALAQWKDTERAVLFPTGYAANLGALTAFADRDTVVCSDALNHASIIDGCRLSRARVAVYDHRDLGRLEQLLGDAPESRRIVVTDTVFSMDGDIAPLEELGAMCAAFDALLVLDEAHAVLGPELPRSFAGVGLDVVRVGTLSKTLGSLGGFVATSRPFAELLVNRARPYIFTTAPTPADAAAALAAVGILGSDEGAALRSRLRGHVDRLQPGHPSPIVPVVFGDEEPTLAAAAALLEQGLLVPAIRPPTVSPGTSRLRVTVSAAHTTEQVEQLAGALRALRP